MGNMGFIRIIVGLALTLALAPPVSGQRVSEEDAVKATLKEMWAAIEANDADRYALCIHGHYTLVP